MDIHDSKTRSYNMSKIKCINTKPEIAVRKILWNKGLRYRLHDKDIPGKPDIVFRKMKKVIFINGCFWHKHGCKYFKWPKTRIDFWKDKINKNTERDHRNYERLDSLGIRYLVLWECEIRKMSEEELLKSVLDFLEN